MTIIAHHQPTIRVHPREPLLDLPTVLLACAGTQWMPALGTLTVAPLTSWHGGCDPAPTQGAAHRGPVIGGIRHHVVWSRSGPAAVAWHPNGLPVGGARVRSCGCALATCRPIGTPVPSPTTSTVAPVPTVVFPPPSPPGVLERRCRPATHVPMPACRRHRGGSGGCATCAPTSRLATTRAIVASRCWETRTPVAGLPRHSPCGAQTPYHALSGGRQCADDPACAVFSG